MNFAFITYHETTKIIITHITNQKNISYDLQNVKYFLSYVLVLNKTPFNFHELVVVFLLFVTTKDSTHFTKSLKNLLSVL